MNRKNQWILSFYFLVALALPKLGMSNHLLGAELHFKSIGSDSIEVTVSAYRQCTGGAVSMTEVPPRLTTDSCSSSITFLYKFISSKVVDITPVCASQQKPCPMSGGNGQGTSQIPVGVEKYTSLYHYYIGNIPANCCWLKANWIQAARSTNITTGFADQVLEINSWYSRCNNNTSPKFNSDPLILKFGGQDVFYNIGAIDVDHDSLSYFMAEPLDGYYNSPWSKNYPLTCYGGNSPNPLSNPPSGFNLNPITGEIIFRPMQIQVTVIKFGINEWRKINGVYTIVGITFRDLVLTVFNVSGNSTPFITTPLNYEVCAGEQLCFEIGTHDANLSDNTSLLIDSASQIPNSTFSILSTSNPRLQRGKFCWSTDSSLIRTQPYTFNMKLQDDHCPVYGSSIYTFKITVSAPPIITTQIKRVSCYEYDITGMLNKPLLNKSTQWQVFYQGALKITYKNQDSIRYTMDSTGTYIFKYLVSNAGCLLTHYDTVYYSLPPPLQIVTTHDTVICKNASITISTVALNGQAPYQYRWYENGLLIDTISSITISVNHSQQYKVEVTSSDSCHSMAYDSVMISADTSYLIMQSLRDTTFCDGAMTHIIPSVLSGTLPIQYSWYENNTLISTKDTLKIIPTKASRYILKSVSSDACYNTVYDTVDVNFLPKTLVVKHQNDTSICSGNSITLTSLVSGGNTYNYSWCPVGKSCSTLPNPVYSFDTTTKVYLEITSNAICTEVYRDTITIHIFPKSPITLSAKNLTINKNQSTIVKASNGSGFVWSGNSIKQNWGDSIEVNPIITSTYKVIGNNIYGCTDSAQITITVTYVGIDNKNAESSKLNIHPNPAKDILVVNCKLTDTKNYTFMIMNSLSQILIEGQLDKLETNIDIRTLEPGIYFIRVGNEVRKFVKL